MSSSPANQFQSPVITLEIIHPTALGHWSDPYSEDTPPTRIRIDDFDKIFRFINRVRKNQAYADRLRFIGVTFVNDKAFTRAFGLLIAAVLPALRNIDTLLLEGCIDNDPGIRSSPVLSSPVHFQRLTNLTCDIPPSHKFEMFLAANPTITDLFCGGSAGISCYVIGSVGSGRILPLGILPNLAVVECDVFLINYYVAYRPVVEVFPRNVMHMDEQGMYVELVSLLFSTAGGGPDVGGGVQTFHLGRNLPLDHLALVAPNLLQLFVYNDDEMTSPPDLFWTTPGWEQNLGLFSRLREIHVQSESPFTRGEQNSLVTRWSTGCATLSHVTFESNVPTAVQQISSPLAHGGPDDGEISSLPALVDSGPDDESDADSEGNDENDHSDGLDEEMSGGQVTTITSRWMRDYDVEQWFLVRD